MEKEYGFIVSAAKDYSALVRELTNSGVKQVEQGVLKMKGPFFLDKVINMYRGITPRGKIIVHARYLADHDTIVDELYKHLIWLFL